jgi:hypothetical protein
MTCVSDWIFEGISMKRRQTHCTFVLLTNKLQLNEQLKRNIWVKVTQAHNNLKPMFSFLLYVVLLFFMTKIVSIFWIEVFDWVHFLESTK